MRTELWLLFGGFSIACFAGLVWFVAAANYKAGRLEGDVVCAERRVEGIESAVAAREASESEVGRMDDDAVVRALARGGWLRD